MQVFYAALLEGHAGKLVERMAARDNYILSLKRDDKSQAALLIALEHYLTQVRPFPAVCRPFRAVCRAFRAVVGLFEPCVGRFEPL